jgi:hypothetical protein
VIVGEGFHTWDLDDRTRDLISVTVLTTMDPLPQLGAHADAALNVWVTPVQLREAVYGARRSGSPRLGQCGGQAEGEDLGLQRAPLCGGEVESRGDLHISG